MCAAATASTGCGQGGSPTKFNGVSYITQMGAAAVFSEEGEKQIRANLDYYRKNAKIIADCMDRLGIWYNGRQALALYLAQMPERHG